MLEKKKDKGTKIELPEETKRLLNIMIRNSIENFLKVCLLEDPQVAISPQDPDEPPSWCLSLPGTTIFWVDRNVLDALLARRHDKSCDTCPSEIKEQCPLNQNSGAKK